MDQALKYQGVTRQKAGKLVPVPQRSRENQLMEGFLTVDDLARQLQVSKVWIYKLARQNRIPHFKIEKCTRFLPSEIRAWLEARRAEVHINQDAREPVIPAGTGGKRMETINEKNASH